MNFLDKLKKRWGANGPVQVVIILIVFALTGFTVLFIKKPIFSFFEISQEKGFIKTVLYLLIVLPLYQGLLLFYGFLFGQFRFFWEKEKKLVKKVKNLFSSKKSPVKQMKPEFKKEG